MKNKANYVRKLILCYYFTRDEEHETPKMKQHQRMGSGLLSMHFGHSDTFTMSHIADHTITLGNF